MDVIQNNDDHNFSDKNNRKEFDQVSTKSRGHFGSKWGIYQFTHNRPK